MDISRLLNPGKRVRTDGLGWVVVHSISVGAMERIASSVGDIENALDEVLSSAVIAETCRLVDDVDDRNERPVPLERIKDLTKADRTAIYKALLNTGKRESTESEDTQPDQAIARELRKQIRTALDTGKKLRESIDRQIGSVADSLRRHIDPLTSARSVLSSETMRMLDQVTAQSDALKAALQKPDWLTQVEDERRRIDAALGPLGSMPNVADSLNVQMRDVSPTHLEFPRIPDFDFSNSPVARTADAVEQHTKRLDELAQAQRLALDINNQMHRLVARVATELSERAKTNETHTKRNFWVAIAAIAVSFLASLGQIGQAYWFNADNSVQQSKAEGIAREQSESLKAILKQSQDDNVALRQLLSRQPEQSARSLVSPADTKPPAMQTPPRKERGEDK